MEAFKKLAVLLKALMLMFFRATLVDAVQPWATTSWGNAHATFYGGNDASGTMGEPPPCNLHLQIFCNLKFTNPIFVKELFIIASDIQNFATIP